MIRLRHFILIAALAATALGGCHRSAGFSVRVEGLKIPREYAAWVDVSNFDGNVQVLASDRFSQPEVRARARAKNDQAPSNFEELRETVKVRAVAAEENGKRVIRVTAEPAVVPPAPVTLDLQIRVPRVWGVHVVNSGGAVELVGISGPVDVQNGRPGASGGDVEIRTGMAMTENVSMTTTSGRVHFQVGPGSSGRIELRTTEGMPFVEAKTGSLNSITYEGNRWRGTLNDGKNTIALRTDKGEARVMILENAGEYQKEYWDGWPKWPTSPRWLAKLGGE